MWKALSAVTAAALLAASISLLPGFNPQVAASAPSIGSQADGSECTRRNWPYYTTNCVLDRSRAEPVKVRIVSTDRVPQANPHTDFDLAPHWPNALAELQVAVPVWASGTQ